MEVRKVQMTGGSSFVVTLPKDWARSIGLRKNDPLGIVVQPDGSLLISPPEKMDTGTGSKVFHIDDLKDPELLFRLLLGAYISGYSSIEMRSEGKIGGELRDTVSRLTQAAIGLEVMEECDNSITVKDLVDPAEMRFHRSIERMRMLVKNMLEDCFSALSRRDPSLLDGIEPRDSDVDRLEWLLSRQMHMALKDVNVSRKLGAAPHEVINSFLMGRILERIGDHAVSISENVRSLIEMELDPELCGRIVATGEEAISLFSESVDVLFSRDVEAANANIDRTRDLVESCREISRAALSREPEAALAASLVAGSIQRTGEYSADLSEIIINILVD